MNTIFLLREGVVGETVGFPTIRPQTHLLPHPS
jgi:hypothetical protein